MLDIFFTQDVCSLLKHKSIVFMGDSNIRALYKDLLCISQKNCLIPLSRLKTKMEPTIYGDSLTSNGPRTNGRNYREEREFAGDLCLSYYFLTRVYNEYVQSVLDKILSRRKPDIIILNSCLWDVTRWGVDGVREYKENLNRLLKQLKDRLPDCLVIWVTTPPISSDVKGGFLLKEIEFLKYSLRFHVVEANHYARKVVVEHGFDVLDSHYHLQMQIHRRENDGTHWSPHAVRYVTNLLLTHITLAWNKILPHRFVSPALQQSIESEIGEESAVVSVQVPPKPQENKVKQKTQAVTAKNKENFDSPVAKKTKKVKKRSPRRHQTHHTYMSNVDYQQRRKRINQWQTTTPESNNRSATNYQTHGTHSANSHHDSGYFSPSEVSLSNDFHSSQRQISFNSPSQFTFSSPQNFQVYKLASHAPWKKNFNGPYYGRENLPLLASPYQYSVKSVQLPNSLYYPASNYRRTLLPYAFPHIDQGQTLQPNINFTSDDFIGF